MTEAKKKDTPEAAAKDAGLGTATESTDSQVAAKAGLSEGEVKALRDDAGLNGLAGHGANLAAWEATEAGKEFVKGEKDRNKEAEEGAKAATKDLDDNGRSEAEKKYFEATGQD